ncbi:MAG: MFS transporter, partial [Betaproteobacteria bacterium]|nr:MFS transporter [Betaproteobacteria bacterium]
NLLCLTRAGSVILALMLTTLAFTGQLNAVLVLIVAGLVSILRVSDLVTRYALSGEIMPPGLLMGAMGISRANVDSARVAGALAGAGAVAAYGIGPAYAVISAFYGVSLLLTLGVGQGRRTPAGPVVTSAGISGAAPASLLATPWRDLREGFAYVRTQPALLAATCLALLVNFSAYPVFFGLLPYVAKHIYAVGQTELGYMAASFGFGSLVGSVLLSATRIAARTARVMLVAGMAWHALLLMFVHIHSLPAGIVLLMLCGMLQSICVTPIAVVMLRGAGEQYRGRVMGLRILMIYGLPIGLFIIGPLINRFGFVPIASLYALAGLLAILLISYRWRAAVWSLDAAANAR